ncbi:MAG: T9SS type A sorting domain-containing protein [bacterium]
MKTFTAIFFTLIASISFCQDAISYFTTDAGTVWKYQVFNLDNSNNKINETQRERIDSLAGQGNFRGRDAYLCLTNLGLGQKGASIDYVDSVLYSFDGTTAAEYSFFFTPPDNGGWVDQLILKIRNSIVGYYDLYQFAKPVNQEYELLSKDTSIVYTWQTFTVPADINTKIVGKREQDENLVTPFGTLATKKFSYNIIITLYLHILPPPADPAVVNFASIPITHWINEDYWIVKEYRPTSQTFDMSELGIPPITIPGIVREISEMRFAVPVVPALKSPQNNGGSIPVNIDIVWHKSEFADMYHIQLASDSLFANIVYQDTASADTSKSISGLLNNTKYFWRVKGKNAHNSSEWSAVWKFVTESLVGIENEYTPEKYELCQNYPNPFNPTTTIKFCIAAVETPYMASLQHGTLEIFDVLGREVATLVDEYLPAGSYTKEWNADNLPSGIYFCRMSAEGGAGSFESSIKLLLLK